MAIRNLSLPPGFRFHPTNEEVITHYLCPKIKNPQFVTGVMGEVDMNKCEPWDLPSIAKIGEKEYYFFVRRDRKYPTGTRTNRATGAGYWKATGKDKEIFSGKVLIGMKKTLVFHTGRAPKGEKTEWVMHEFRLEGNYYNNLPKSVKEKWVVCKVLQKDQKNEQRVVEFDGLDYSLPALLDPNSASSSNTLNTPVAANFDNTNQNFCNVMPAANMQQISPVLQALALASDDHLSSIIRRHGEENQYPNQFGRQLQDTTFCIGEDIYDPYEIDRLLDYQNIEWDFK